MKRSYNYAPLFVALFVSVLVVRITAQYCWKDDDDNREEPFWKTGVVYQIYPRSFADSDGDGIGDLKGIAEKADYLVELGVDIVWLSPICESPMRDFGYDISNFTAIDPIFGTMEDFDFLMNEVHSRGIKFVMDFVPGYTSDLHEWFIKSEAREGIYTDYYVWTDAKGFDPEGNPIPPNNWVSKFRGSAWAWSEMRQQFYYHEFLREQPDLNYRSDYVRQEMEAVMRFWLDKGVDGFRVDAFQFLVEVEDVSLNEPLNPDSGTDDPDDPDYLDHIYTTNQPLTYEVLREWRILVDEHPKDILLMVEVYDDVDEVMKYYGNESVPLAHFPFNFFVLDYLRNRSLLTGDVIKDTISLWLDNLPEGMWPNWVLGNHDNSRMAARLGQDLVDAFNMMTLLLPGTAVTYYGEEIGMDDTFITWEETMDPQGCRWGQEHYLQYSRDPERTPMQWNDGYMAGFTNGNDTWLPINPNYVEVNVVAQEAVEKSSLTVYKRLIELREQPTFRYGSLSYPTLDQYTFSFIRYLEGYPSYLLVINTAEEDRVVNLHYGANFPLPDVAVVVLRSSTDEAETTSPGSVVFLTDLPLVAGEGLLLELP